MQRHLGLQRSHRLAQQVPPLVEQVLEDYHSHSPRAFPRLLILLSGLLILLPGLLILLPGDSKVLLAIIRVFLQQVTMPEVQLGVQVDESLGWGRPAGAAYL